MRVLCFCLHIAAKTYAYMGVDAAFNGIFSLVVFDTNGIVWLANPLLFFSWRMSNRYLSLALSTVATMLSFAFLFYSQGSTPNESLSKIEIIKYGTCYWLWLGSMAVMAIGNALVLYKQKNNSN